PEQIVATQIVEITPGEPVEVTPHVFKRLLDTCVVRYKIENRDARPHKVGLRILIDTFIGENDGVPFVIPGSPGLVSTSLEMRGNEVPDFIQAQENPSLTDPGTIAQMKLRLGGRIEAPGRVVLTRLPDRDPGRTSKLWNYHVSVVPMGDDS